MDAAELILDAERRLHDPGVRVDREAMGALLAPDFQLFGSSGLLWTRDEMLDAVGVFESTIIPMEMVGLQTREIAPDVWLVTYLSAVGTRKARRTSIWRMTDAGPRAVHHQGTPLS